MSQHPSHDSTAQPLARSAPGFPNIGTGAQQEANPTPELSEASTQWLAIFAMAALMTGLYFFAEAAYFAWRDAFVTPIILSPDSDLVLPSKLKLARLTAEREALAVREEETTQLLNVAERGVVQLTTLKSSMASSLDWSDLVTSQKRASSASDLRSLARQRKLLAQRIREQQAHVVEVSRHVEAGLARKTDLLHERDVLSKLRISAIENERDRLASAVVHNESVAAQRALHSGARKKGIATPEMLRHQEQLVRIELELQRLAADKKARASELESIRTEVGRLDDLIDQIKRRPVFRAVTAAQHVVFVPYAQLETVVNGAGVYECRLWGIFRCRRVGRIAEVLAGEVNMEDPWGAPTRGQYALLALSNEEGAKARVLRVRP
ncbi:MAG: hypothetical protein OXU20_18425 [Myxococcales bacterium]|nr:hypothetical protein [Myxococcales bacterium]MDD9967341.1 hypothetical protein [Myxococcales bacterium]